MFQTRRTGKKLVQLWKNRKNIRNLWTKKYNFSTSHSQDSNNSKSNNIWDFLDDILEEDKRKKETSYRIPDVKEEFEVEDRTQTLENKTSFSKRKPLENNQKSFEKLEDCLSSGKKLKCESPFGKLEISDSQKEKMNKNEIKLSQMQQKKRKFTRKF